MKRWTIVFPAFVLIVGAALAFQKAKAITEPGKPDLIVDQKRLLQNWVVRDEKLAANSCSVEEGGITPGEHRLIRFTVSTPNIGNADLVVGDANVHFAMVMDSLSSPVVTGTSTFDITVFTN